MKIKMFTIKFFAGMIVALLMGTTLTAQSGWQQVYTGSGLFLRDMVFVPGDDSMWQTGWAMAWEGTIVKTTDGGDTWNEITQTLSNQLGGITFVDESTGYIACLDGQILKSTDGGETWSVNHTISGGFDKISFKDEMNGLVTGTEQLYTNDGGATWLTSSGSTFYWDNDHGGGDTYYGINLGGPVGKTTDGGETWNDIYTTAPNMLATVDFYDEMTGLVGGDLSNVWVTHDGGDNWVENGLGEGEGLLVASGFVNEDIMYATGSPSEIYKSIDGGETWETDTIIENQSYRALVATSTNVVFVCGEELGGADEGVIWRNIGEMPLVAAFESSETIICAGSSVDFTDLSYYNVESWDWTFEGGTPSSSTDQNPTVTYNGGGLFDVTLTVTNEDGDTETIIETDFIEVFETPAQPEIPSGEENICTGNSYNYTVPALDYAQTYEWELSPADAGTLTWDENEAYLEVSDTWTGDFTLRVMAGNFCGDGPWSDFLNGTISISPDAFVLQGGGSYCAGGEGVEITLDGSQEGVNYELYLEGETTGNIVSGTGSAISFGMQTEAGIYDAFGFIESCETYMSEQVEVTVLPLPTPEIAGPDMVCDEDVTDYETTDNAGSTYTWEVAGGTIIDGQGTYMVTIEWGEPGNGTVTVTEEDENGCEATTEAFEVFIDDCTDISENGLNEFNVYPNPATSRLNVEFTNGTKEDTRIIIFNHLGQVVLESDQSAKDGKQIVQLDVTGLTKGLYIIKVQSGNESVITKQIIKN